MKTNRLLMTFAFIASSTALTACAQTSTPQGMQSEASLQSEVAPANTGLPMVLVHKSASCGCCNAWVDHLRQQGFKVQVRDVDDMGPVKQRLGIPYGKGSCHTAEVGGYFVEGHVPASDIKRLLAEKPAAKGLVLPGMPLGSPGMEVPDGTVQPYTVELVQADGTTGDYSQHGAD